MVAVGPTLDRLTFAEVRRRMILDHCKWDPQVGDVSTLANFPLVMPATAWDDLATCAEQLAAETRAAEAFVLRSPPLQRWIGVPWRLRRALRGGTSGTVQQADGTLSTVRSMRFDFHPTAEGWRVSEVNSDVPGGFTEASAFTSLMAEHYPRYRPAADPAGIWAAAIARNATGPIALLAAPGFMEDQQVVAYLASRLRQLGVETVLAEPAQLSWRGGYAYFAGLRLSAILRFYQVEWLVRLPRRSGWRNLITGGHTPVMNPGSCVISESKRFPLVWDALPFAMPTWRRLLPETRDPRNAPWQTDNGWLLKSTYCNTGDTVTIRDQVTAKTWQVAAWDARRRPRGWVAQRRFHTLALDGPSGRIYPCIGVYVIDGRAAGAYARCSPGAVVDYAATDVPLLIEGGVQ